MGLTVCVCWNGQFVLPSSPGLPSAGWAVVLCIMEEGISLVSLQEAGSIHNSRACLGQHKELTALRGHVSLSSFSFLEQLFNVSSGVKAERCMM